MDNALKPKCSICYCVLFAGNCVSGTFYETVRGESRYINFQRMFVN